MGIDVLRERLLFLRYIAKWRLEKRSKNQTLNSLSRGRSMERFTTNDPETRSTDDVAENVDRLRVLFPEAVTEGIGRNGSI